MSSDAGYSGDRHATETDSSWARTAWLIVAAWAVILGFVVGFGWLLTHPLSGSVGKQDNDIARWFADQRTATLNDLANVGTLLGETVVELIVAPVVAVAVSWWRRSLVPGLFVALVTGGVGGFYFLASTIDPRQRPPVKILDPGLVPTHSFPSGHVGTATALYGCIIVLTWVYAPAARWWVAAVLFLPLVVLVSRLYQGAHHVTDVLTSLVYASIWLGIVATLLLRDHARAAHLPSPGDTDSAEHP